MSFAVPFRSGTAKYLASRSAICWLLSWRPARIFAMAARRSSADSDSSSCNMASFPGSWLRTGDAAARPAWSRTSSSAQAILLEIPGDIGRVDDLPVRARRNRGLLLREPDEVIAHRRATNARPFDGDRGERLEVVSGALDRVLRRDRDGETRRVPVVDGVVRRRGIVARGCRTGVVAGRQVRRVVPLIREDVAVVVAVIEVALEL